MSDERTNVFDELGNEAPSPDQGAIEPDAGSVAPENSKNSKSSTTTKSSTTSSNAKTSTTSTTSKKTFISIDNDPGDVLDLQRQGADLYFEDGKRFLELSVDAYEELSSLHQLRYTTARQITEGTLDFSRKRVVPRPGHGYATARNRLAVDGGKPGKHYTWQYADQLDWWEANGARPVVDPTVKTFTNPTGTTRTITESDGRKLVLLEMPEEVNEARRAHVREKTRKLREGYDESARNNLERSGASVVEKKEIERPGGDQRVTLDGGQ
jgi:hypothetical protein